MAGFYDALISRGERFHVSTLPAGVALTNGVVQTVSLSIYNPPTSGKNVRLRNVTVTATAGVISSGSVILLAFSNPVEPGGTALTPYSDFGGTPSTVVKFTSNVGVAPTLVKNLVHTDYRGQSPEELDFILEPGKGYGISGDETVLGPFMIGLTFEETLI